MRLFIPISKYVLIVWSYYFSFIKENVTFPFKNRVVIFTTSCFSFCLRSYHQLLSFLFILIWWLPIASLGYSTGATKLIKFSQRGLTEMLMGGDWHRWLRHVHCSQRADFLKGRQKVRSFQNSGKYQVRGTCGVWWKHGSILPLEGLGLVEEIVSELCPEEGLVILAKNFIAFNLHVLVSSFVQWW